MIHIGVDPGLGGAIAVADFSSGDIRIEDMPVMEILSGGKSKKCVSAHKLADMLRVYGGRQDVVCAVELVGAMPGQGVVSMFNFGQSTGILLGVLAALQVPYFQVSPVRWKKHVMKDMGKDKDASVVKAMQMFPSLSEHLVSKRGKKLDGRAEALLLAHYASTSVS